MIDDTADFFDLDDFAEIVTLNGKKIKAIFDIVPTEHNEGFALVKGYSPRLTVQTVDVIKSNAVLESPVVVRKKNYEVADIQDDGQGITSIHLYDK